MSIKTNLTKAYTILEQERNLLKITLDYLAKENENLKNRIEDMNMTVKENKEQLRVYVEQITDKDKLFEKMNSQIEYLKTRVKSLEEYVKVFRGRDKDKLNNSINFELDRHESFENINLNSLNKKSSNELISQGYSHNNSTNPNTCNITNNTNPPLPKSVKSNRKDLPTGKVIHSAKKPNDKIKEV